MNRAFAVLCAVVLSLALGIAGASAARGGGGNGGHGTSTITLQSVSSRGEAGPYHGDQVTFAVNSTETSRPYVILNCYQGKNWVYTAQAGFWDGYTLTRTFLLSSSAWTAGDADCTATLGDLNIDGTRFRSLASTSFHVVA